MTAPFAHITSHCFVNVPFERLRKYLRLISDHRLQPEIGLDGDVLYTRSRADFTGLARFLKAEGLACTLHAPFVDLAPGAVDPYIRQASRNKLRKAFELIEVFEPVAVVCHLNYEKNKHGYKQAEWLRHSLDTWRDLLDLAARHRTPLMLENTYETEAAMHRLILEELASDYARFCFDVGHSMAFAHSDWRDWLPELAPWLGQLHLHDNNGDTDEHLAVGAGRFDFAGLFAYLKTAGLQPVITLEPHEEAGLWASLAALDKLGLFG